MMLSQFQQIISNTNLWKKDDKYYRLFAKGVTPNGCWLVAPKMVRLVDINIATGKYEYGEEEYEFSVAGEVPIHVCVYIMY